jgi:hypothetical protein
MEQIRKKVTELSFMWDDVKTKKSYDFLSEGTVQRLIFLCRFVKKINKLWC